MTQQNNMAVQPANGANMSALTGFKENEISLIKQTVAKGTTDLELAYFLKIANQVDLNPLVKEIWCYKDNRNNLMIFAGRDGFRSVLQRHPDFLSLNSVEVCAKDDFKMGTDEDGNLFVKHSFGTGERGEIIGAYAIVKLKSGGKVIEWASMKIYNKGYNTWKTHPDEMIKKVAEIHAAKKASNIRGIYAEEEVTIKNGTVYFDNPDKKAGGATAVADMPDKNQQIDKEMMDALIALAAQKGSKVEAILSYYKLPALAQMTEDVYGKVMAQLNKKPDVVQAQEAEVIEVPYEAEQETEQVSEVPTEEVVPMPEPPAPQVKQAPIQTQQSGQTRMDVRKFKSTAVPAPMIEDDGIVGIPGDVARTVNHLMTKDPLTLSQDERDLVRDCNTGKFKSHDAYVQVDWLL